jgi:hypothetical protein
VAAEQNILRRGKPEFKWGDAPLKFYGEGKTKYDFKILINIEILKQ